MNSDSAYRNWGWAWVGLALALGLHVADEALTGFLPMYNAAVESIRASYSWFPMPTFTFKGWLSGLIFGVVVLLSLSPLVFAGLAAMRSVSYAFAILMIANAFGHTGVSIYLGTFAPGVFSSPVIFVAAVALFVTARRARPQSRARDAPA